MEHLNIDPLSIITKYLLPTDIISLQHTCRHLYKVLQADIIWNECMSRNQNIRARAISDQLRNHCPNFIIIHDYYACYLLDHNPDLEGIDFHSDDHSKNYELVSMSGGYYPSDKKIIDGEWYELYKKLDIAIPMPSIIFYNKGCSCKKCVCDTYARTFTHYHLQTFSHSDYPVLTYKIDRCLKNGLYYMNVFNK